MAMSLELETFASGELRHDGRVPFQRRAWCEHRDLTLYLVVANLSRGGMFIQTTTPFALGERLRVCVLDAPRIVVDVEIVRCATHRRHAGIGCRLLSFVAGADSYDALLVQLSEANS
jgi:Tfp pilus assembly protein PilZ